MQCITPSECSEWLHARGIAESPYSSGKVVGAGYFQFEPPRKLMAVTAFTRWLFEEFGEFSGALVMFTDWRSYHLDEMALVGSLRRSHAEQRPLIDAPGHVFASSEQAEAIGNCYLALTFGWSAYLYLASGAATVYFWEGDLIDFWSPREELTKAVLDVVRRFELQVTDGTPLTSAP